MRLIFHLTLEETVTPHKTYLEQRGKCKKPLSMRLKNRLNMWRLVFLVLIVVYVSFLLLDLGTIPLQWDETNHLNGGVLLLRSHFR